MKPQTQSRQSSAKRIWGACRSNPEVASLFESVFREHVPGAVLLASTDELLGAFPINIGPLRLSLELTGLPYASHPIDSMIRSAALVLDESSRIKTSLSEVRARQAELQSATESEFLDRIVLGVLETIRQNEGLKQLIDTPGPLTRSALRQGIRDYSNVDFGPLQSAATQLAPFVSRRKQRRALASFLAPVRELIASFDTRPLELQLAAHELGHFQRLLVARKVSESAWRRLLLDLLDKQFVTAAAPIYFWCIHCCSGMVVEFLEGDLLRQSAPCPWCDRVLRVLTSFAPSGALREAMLTTDGVLGVAVGWHMRRLGIRFDAGLDVGGAEVDFLIGGKKNTVLIECKMHDVLGGPKPLTRHLVADAQQLSDHVRLVESTGRRVMSAACVVNLRRPLLRQVLKLMSSDSRIHDMGERNGEIIAFQDFPAWLHKRARR